MKVGASIHHDARMHQLIQLFSALPTDASVPEWIHLVPAGSFKGIDGRGPYTLADPASVITHSMQASGGKLPIDENHSIDLAAPKGEPSPARGWIVQLEARSDGIWGRVEWTPAGQALMAEKAYRGISPGLMVAEKTLVVGAIARASLTNNPNLNLTTLHHRSQDMDLEKLRKALGLAATATEADILAAAEAQKTAIATHGQQLATIAAAAGLDAATAPDQLVVQLQQRQAAAGDAGKMASTVIALQTQLETLQGTIARGAAEHAIDDAIKAGKVGLKPLRDHYIARHMADPEGVAKEIAAMPSLHSGGFKEPPKPGVTGAEGLSAEERQVAHLMGIEPEAFAKAKADMTLETL